MFTQVQFIEVCAAHGILADKDTLKVVFQELKALSKAKKHRSVDTHARDLIAAYCDAFHTAHGYDPVIKPAEGKLARVVVDSVGLDVGIELVRTYVRMPDQFFKMKRYDFMTFYQNINAVKQKLDTGRGMTSLQARAEEQKEANIDAVRNYLEKTRGQE